MSPVISLIKISPCKHDVSKEGLPQSKQSGMPDTTVAMWQYNNLYAL